MQKTHNPYLLLVLTSLFWGGNAVAGKLAVGHVSPFTVTFGRWVVVVAILLPFAIPYIRRDWKQIRENWLYLFLLGSCGFTIFNNLMYLSLTYTTAINVAIEQAAMPLIVFALNYLLYRTAITWLQIAGYMLTLAGVIITATHGNWNIESIEALNRGDLIMISAIMVYGAYSVFLKNKPDIHVISLMTVLAISALIVATGFFIWEANTDRFIKPDLQGWGVIFYAAVFPSILGQIFWVKGLEAIGSNRGGLFINLVPIFGALLAILILGEQFRLYHAAGLAFVLTGIWIAQHTLGKKKGSS